MSKKTKQELHDEAVAILRESITVNDDIVVVQDGALEKLLPKDLTPEIIRKVDSFRQSILPPVTQVVGEALIALNKKHPNTGHHSCELDVYGAKLNIQVNDKANTPDERVQISYTHEYDYVQDSIEQVTKALHEAYDA